MARTSCAGDNLELRARCSLHSEPGRRLFIHPLRAALVALPVVLADRERNIQKHQTIADRAIESLEADIERTTAGTARPLQPLDSCSAGTAFSGMREGRTFGLLPIDSGSGTLKK
jgi:hypothetical protein